jgi:hypothetical protein
MWHTTLLRLLAGAMGANATPHFVKGITKETYPNVFGGSPVSNLVAGWAGFVLTALLVYWAHPERHPLWSLASGAWVSCSWGCFTLWVSRLEQRATTGYKSGSSGTEISRAPRRPLYTGQADTAAVCPALRGRLGLSSSRSAPARSP